MSYLVQALTQRIDSVTQLDVLLLVASAARGWSAPEVASELRIGPDWAGQHLDMLARRGLLAHDQAGYALTRHPQLAPAVEELGRLYRTHPVAIITAIYKSEKRLEDFADAFRLRKNGNGHSSASSAAEPKEFGHG
jgi:hypothetical protein